MPFSNATAAAALALVAPAAPSDLAPLIGEWRSDARHQAPVLNPVRRIAFTDGIVMINGSPKPVRQVWRHGNIISVQIGPVRSGPRVLHSFEVLGPNRICRVAMGNVSVPESAARLIPPVRKQTIGCFERVQAPSV